MIVERRRGRGKETDTTALHSFLLQLAFSLETSHGEELIRWIAARGIRYLHQVWINQRKCITRYFSREREWNKKKRNLKRIFVRISFVWIEIILIEKGNSKYSLSKFFYKKRYFFKIFLSMRDNAIKGVMATR